MPQNFNCQPRLAASPIYSAESIHWLANPVLVMHQAAPLVGSLEVANRFFAKKLLSGYCVSMELDLGPAYYVAISVSKLRC